MAKKITINPVQAGNGLETAINLRLQQIEDTFNDNVLWRAGVGLNPNSMAVDLDMAENDILNLLELTLGEVSVKADILQNQTDIADLKLAVNALWPKGWGYAPFPGATWKWGSISGSISDQSDLHTYLTGHDADIAALDVRVTVNEANIATNAADISAEEVARINEDLTFVKLDGSRTMTGALATSHGGFTSSKASSASAAPFDFSSSSDIYNNVNYWWLNYQDTNGKGLRIKTGSHPSYGGKAIVYSTVGFTGIFDSQIFQAGGAIGQTLFTDEVGSTYLGFNPGSNAIVTGNSSSITIAGNYGGQPFAYLGFTQWYPGAGNSTSLGNATQHFTSLYMRGTVYSYVPDGASAVAHTLRSPTYTTAGAKLLSVTNAVTEKFSIDKDGVASAEGSPTSASHLTRKDYVDTQDAAAAATAEENAIAYAIALGG